MRQAGRILPEYRKIREHMSFPALIRSPEKVAEVTEMPIQTLSVDAAILFTDILIIPEAMGLTLSYQSGPMFENTIRTRSDVEALSSATPEQDLDYVLDAVDATLSRLDGSVPLIGFAGSPWTLACYMVEGTSSKRYHKTRRMAYDAPDVLHDLLKSLTAEVTSFLQALFDRGIHALQIFDTTAGVLSPALYQEFSLQYVQDIISALPDEVPLIYFGKGTGYDLEGMAETGADVVGLDWRVNLSEARNRIGDQCVLQGNLDPAALYGSRERIREETCSVLSEFGNGSGHIMNLGHGVYPDTDKENVQHFVECVREESPGYHETSGSVSSG